MERLGERLKGVTIEIQPFRQRMARRSEIQLENVTGGGQVNGARQGTRRYIVIGVDRAVLDRPDTCSPRSVGPQPGRRAHRARRAACSPRISEPGLAPPRIPGIHKLIVLPDVVLHARLHDRRQVGPQKPLVIRTKDNNTVEIEVSVPIRIIAGRGATTLVEAGNHVQDPDGRFPLPCGSPRRPRPACSAEADGGARFRRASTRPSAGSRRTRHAQGKLNKQLAPMHVEGAGGARARR